MEGVISVDRAGSSSFKPWLRDLRQTQGRRGRAPSPEAGKYIAGINALGVPGFAPTQDGRYYFNYPHTPADTLDKVDPQGLNENAAVMTVLAYALADAPSQLRVDSGYGFNSLRASASSCRLG